MKRQEIIKLFSDLVDTQQIDEMVYTMNKIFKTKSNPETPNSSISYVGFDSNVSEQCLNVYDEVEELLDAIEADDKKEIADALADILTFGYGAIYILSPTDKDKFISDYVPKINNAALDNIESAARVLHSMFSSENTVGNIVEGIVFAEYWASRLKLDLLSLMRAVTKSNYTKLLLNIKEAIDTLAYYRDDLKVESLYFKYDSVVLDGNVIEYSVIFSGADQLDRKNKQYRKDKFLKCVEFQDPSVFAGFNTGV